MKKVMFILLLIALVGESIMALGSVKAVEIYVCHTSKNMAELQAKAMTSNRVLAVVSSCTCESVHEEMKSQVPKVKKIENRGYSFEMVTCQDKKVGVYACTCYGYESH